MDYVTDRCLYCEDDNHTVCDPGREFVDGTFNGCACPNFVHFAA